MNSHLCQCVGFCLNPADFLVFLCATKQCKREFPRETMAITECMRKYAQFAANHPFNTAAKRTYGRAQFANQVAKYAAPLLYAGIIRGARRDILEVLGERIGRCGHMALIHDLLVNHPYIVPHVMQGACRGHHNERFMPLYLRNVNTLFWNTLVGACQGGDIALMEIVRANMRLKFTQCIEMCTIALEHRQGATVKYIAHNYNIDKRICVGQAAMSALLYTIRKYKIATLNWILDFIVSYVPSDQYASGCMREACICGSYEIMREILKFFTNCKDEVDRGVEAGMIAICRGDQNAVSSRISILQSWVPNIVNPRIVSHILSTANMPSHAQKALINALKRGPARSCKEWNRVLTSAITGHRSRHLLICIVNSASERGINIAIP